MKYGNNFEILPPILIASVDTFHYILEFVKENGNSCVMWIDLSTDKKESNKSLSRKSDVITEPDNLLIKSKDPNSTYIIEKGASVDCSPDINNKNLNTMIIGENECSNECKSPKSSCDNIKENTQSDNSDYLANRNGDNDNNLTVVLTSRRKSSSTFIETLRKLVCMHER